ncbi:MAG: phosphatidylglycerophosphatase A [Planctomycetes bacterium]|nr:phosphatidylglycerophosphatase A [Planctomycetota bacterium]
MNQSPSVPAAPIPPRLWWHRALILLGSVGPLGYLPASGTATVAVVGIPLFWLTRGWPLAVYLPATVAFTAAAVALHHTGDVLLGEKDSRKLVWDELVGFLFATIAVPFNWKTAAIAFFLERGIDILKVPPGRQIEDHLPGGWGVVGDDVVAGLYTCAVLHALCFVFPVLRGGV